MTEIITVGHSPDPDDAFMFYALAREKIDTCGLRFEHVLQDIQTLNERARRAELDVTAISAHAYPSIADSYALLESGASVGDRYGPLLVARKGMTPEEAGGRVIAIPGELTTAALVLRLALPAAETTVVPFDEIPDAVLDTPLEDRVRDLVERDDRRLGRGEGETQDEGGVSRSGSSSTRGSSPTRSSASARSSIWGSGGTRRRISPFRWG